MSKTWYPVINEENCVECGACFDKCSHDVFKKEAGKPIVTFPEGCVEGCHGSQSLCPADAIAYFGEDEGTESCSCGCDCGCCN
ncbi:MAG TPA: 4Fe-4S binding protein [Ruminiclostridium sp.]|nr:4Fe-4S binding protein [Ruminiclostridium sp.]